jgi:hypothetical protein
MGGLWGCQESASTRTGAPKNAHPPLSLCIHGKFFKSLNILFESAGQIIATHKNVHGTCDGYHLKKLSKI